MRTKYDIESDLIQVTASLADLAICGIGRKNADMKKLAEQALQLLEEAEGHKPKIVTMDGKPLG